MAYDPPEEHCVHLFAAGGKRRLLTRSHRVEVSIEPGAAPGLQRVRLRRASQQDQARRPHLTSEVHPPANPPRTYELVAALTRKHNAIGPAQLRSTGQLSAPGPAHNKSAD